MDSVNQFVGQVCSMCVSTKKVTLNNDGFYHITRPFFQERADPRVISKILQCSPPENGKCTFGLWAFSGSIFCETARV